MYAIRIQGKNIVAPCVHDNLLSLAALLKAGFEVHFKAGSANDVSDGGLLITPEGHKIQLLFANNLWRLPMWSRPTRATQSVPSQRHLPTSVSANTYDTLPCEPCLYEALAEDLAVVMNQTHVSEIEANSALCAFDGDVIEAILAIEEGLLLNLTMSRVSTTVRSLPLRLTSLTISPCLTI